MNTSIYITILLFLFAGMPSVLAQEQEYFKESHYTSSGSKRVEAEKLFEQGRKDFEDGAYPSALEYLNDCISLRPDHALAYFTRGGTKESLKDYKGALTDYDILLHLDPEMVEGWFNRAILKYKLQKYTEAIEDFNRLLEMPSPNTQAVYFKSTSYGDSGNGVSQMITMYSKDADIYNYLGLAKTKLGETDAAIDDFNKALSYNAHDGNIWVNRGLAWKEKGDIKAAHKDFRKALEVEPDHATALFNLSLDNKGDKQDLETYDRIIDSNENFPSAYINRGLIKYQQGDFKGALADFDKAIKLDKSSSIAFFNRALVREKLKLYKEALMDLNVAIKMDPSLTKAFSSRGNVYFKLNDFESALINYDQVIAASAADPATYYNRALVRYKLNQNQEACADLQIAIEQGFKGAQKALDKYCGGDKE